MKPKVSCHGPGAFVMDENNRKETVLFQENISVGLDKENQ